MKVRKVQVFTDGIVGEMLCWGHGMLPRCGPLYDSSTHPERSSLLKLCQAYLLKRGGDFVDAMLAGIYIVYTTRENSQGEGFMRDTTTRRTFYPYLTPELQTVVAHLTDNSREYLALRREEPVVVEWDGLDNLFVSDDSSDFYPEHALDPLLNTFWERVNKYQAPGEPANGALYHWVDWDEWAGDGYYLVHAHNMRWDRQTGSMLPQHLKNGQDLFQFIARQDDVSRMKFTFCGDRIVVEFSGHDTLNGRLTLTPCPNWAWAD